MPIDRVFVDAMCSDFLVLSKILGSGLDAFIPGGGGPTGQLPNSI